MALLTCAATVAVTDDEVFEFELVALVTDAAMPSESATMRVLYQQQHDHRVHSNDIFKVTYPNGTVLRFSAVDNAPTTKDDA